MTNRFVTTGILLALAALNPWAGEAQSPPAFEVASVKPQPWRGEGSVGVRIRGNTLDAEHSSLQDLIEFAWDLRDVQLSGVPAWAARGPLASADLYQVVAKAPGDTPPSFDQFRLMLQALLADRFQLKIRHASRALPIFNLVAAKSGPKLRESPAETKFSMSVDGTVSGGKLTRIIATHATLAPLLEHIEHQADRPVFDKTNLAGDYDFELEWAPAGLDVSPADPVGISLFTALERQLGLKLEPATAPFDTVVVDHAEKPTGN